MRPIPIFRLHSWRHQALAMTATLAVVLAMADAHGTGRFLLTKAAAALLALAAWHFGRKWARQGRLDDITEED